MSIPKPPPPQAERQARRQGGRQPHYFDPAPAAPSRPKTLYLHLSDLNLELASDRGVFGFKGIDTGTLALLKEAPQPPKAGDILDLGTGYGPIAVTLARRSPAAHVWAVDVNERALELTRDNAKAAGAPNLTAALPDQVPSDVRFAAIYSNPPVRVGKARLHELLLRWLPRLAEGASAYLVVQRNLGSDSLAAWLTSSGYKTDRLASKKGYRVIQVGGPDSG